MPQSTGPFSGLGPWTASEPLQTFSATCSDATGQHELSPPATLAFRRSACRAEPARLWI